MKKLKFLLLFVSISCSSIFLNAQKTKLIKFETNKVLCLFNFLETAKHVPSAAPALIDYIEENLGNDAAFNAIVKRYTAINFNYELKREEYPFSRHNSTTAKDFIWVASSNSLNINDFSSRIIGVLPNQAHGELIATMKAVEPFYDNLIWNNQQKNIARIENQLLPYGDKIEELFLKISKFYGTEWNTEIPFKVMLYPIPLERGGTTAIPKGNTLICSFLSEREDDYIGRLGVIIHEMCHIIFGEQSLELQLEIDEWFTSSDSDYAKLSYSYIDEGLATAIGNGWAYQQIHGEIDTAEWYNNKYINGYAHSLFDLVSEYLAKGKTMDKDFANNAITLFGKTFPKANAEISTLLNEVQIFANSETKEGVDNVFGAIGNHFQLRSAWLSTPISDEKSIANFNKKQTTKLFVIEKNNALTLKTLEEHFKTFLNHFRAIPILFIALKRNLQRVTFLF